MSTDIVAVSTGVTLLGPSQASTADIENSLRLAPFLLAADGGARAALALGHIPDRVIGDFDSFSDHDAIPRDRLFRISEQDSTDFEKCLSRTRADIVLALGFTGQRLDHELAVYNTLVRHADKPCIVIGEQDIAFAAPPSLTLAVTPGTRVSLFPLAPTQARATGLRWPIDGLELAPNGRVGTSNQATGPVTLSLLSGALLVILPKELLPQALEALVPG